MAKRFVRGQRITRFPGSHLNELHDRVAALERLVPQPQLLRPPTSERPFLVVPVKSTINQILFERSIVGVKESAFTPPDIIVPGGGSPDLNTATLPVLLGTPVEIEAPDETKHGNGRMVVTLGPIAALGCGWGVVLGLVWARVDLTDETHKAVALKTGDRDYFKSAASGLTIWSRKKQNLAGSQTLGKQWALVLVGGGVSGAQNVFRLIRGLVKGAVTADDTTFLIDNVIPLANGVDPVGGNAATEITVQNVQKEAFADNAPVTAIYDGANWELVLVERYRAVRGLATASVSSGTSSFSIDNINVLCSGLDPRSNPASTAETLTVYNVHADTYADNDKVEADYNVATHQWDCRRKGSSGGSSTLRKARVYGGNITAATGNESADWGGGNVKFLDDTTGVLDANPTAVDNQWDSTWLEDAMVTVDTAHSPPRVENGTCEEFVAWTEP